MVKKDRSGKAQRWVLAWPLMLTSCEALNRSFYLSGPLSPLLQNDWLALNER